jgi:hypothetical protein
VVLRNDGGVGKDPVIQHIKEGGEGFNGRFPVFRFLRTDQAAVEGVKNAPKLRDFKVLKRFFRVGQGGLLKESGDRY